MSTFSCKDEGGRFFKECFVKSSVLAILASYIKIHIMRNSPKIGKELRCLNKTKKKWPVNNRSDKTMIQVFKHGWKVETIKTFIEKN